MPSLQKIAFVSPLASAYTHRLLRGMLSFAENVPGVVVREFRVTRDIQPHPDGKDPLSALLDWKPDGIASLLEQGELTKFFALMETPCPVVNMCNVAPQPGLTLVYGSFSAQIRAVIKHFRQLGLRSIAMLILENYDQIYERSFLEIAQIKQTTKAVHTEIVDPSLLDNPDTPLTSIPSPLKSWLMQLPKPAGVFCPELGGGGYLIRVCEKLGLMVPDEIAVVGADDADASLSTNPTLTSIIPCGEKIGYEAAKILIGILNGAKPPEKAVLFAAMDLRVRQSTGLRKIHLCDIAAAMSHINQHACSGLTVDELIQATQQVSYKTFHTHFKESTGMTPGEAIQQKQIEEASRLLTGTKLSLTLIAERCGFGSSSDFARRFRACTGHSPSDFRKKSSLT